MIRNWLSNNLGVSPVRKEQVYTEIYKSVSLKDVSYWIEVLFSAGIATLGLVLNSPAVIIGAMLISPLMGSILANGLSLAAGDVILAWRALIKLILSCGVAISFALFLVWLLPFKEMTPEILARTRPNVLDLVVALFSGAVGSVAICKQPKGVVTSIPGVAIAVALMPPLCVVGYGLGIAASQGFTNGLQVASGGGLLFFTNLVAITFTAMIVFLALNVDSARAKQSIREWRQQDKETIWMRNILENLPASKKLRKIGTLPARFMLILFTIVAIFIPLNQSFRQLKREVARQQEENSINSAVKEIWQENFANLPNGEPRSFIGGMETRPKEQRLFIQIQVFTSKLYTPEEQNSYVKKLARRLNKLPELLTLKLIEIPTASNEVIRSLPQQEPETVEPAVVTIAQLHANFTQEIQTAMSSLRLPPPAEIVNYEVTTTPTTPLKVQVIYLSERDISSDAQLLLADDIKTRLAYPSAMVSMNRISPAVGDISFTRNESQLTQIDIQRLDRVADILQQQSALRLQVTTHRQADEPKEILLARFQTIKEYLESKRQIRAERIAIVNGDTSRFNAVLRLTTKSSNQTFVAQSFDNSDNDL
ncbi:DUF389 domain-containing protein [Mastigocoleus testarum]|uniref:TIGR00341 family protein n=1 Tax=Mastigocoleus testarum BC008 TaxID=371196 RepID=A0A0V8A0N6_9CYAN|nr:DUF389 domain-containing protein [Mastigocoleus testarum]KST70340.1 hypothetical protein BC008_44895 [Mastigocoleus testarum BC008]